MGFGSLGTAIRAIACILTLHLCHSVLAISPAERDLQILLKAFATNGDAFADYLNSLPHPIDVYVGSIYTRWLGENKDQVITTEFASPKEVGLSSASLASTNCNTAPAPAPAPTATPSPAAPPASNTAYNPKKGAGMVYFSNVNKALSSARMSWTYNWWYQMNSNTRLPAGTQFIPMIYSAAEATSYNLFLAKQSGTGIVLGFNEPNEKNQADNTVEEAIAAWKYLQNSGLRLGSPATSVTDDGTKPDSWIGRFMTQINANAYHVDFMTVHWYGNISYFDQPDKATADLKAYLQAYRNIYQRNIWLTEFALADFGNSTNNYSFTFASYPQQVAFLKAATTMLESLSFVERYAWYYLSPDGVYDGQNGLALDTGSLYFQNGSATPTGLAFQPL